MDLSWEEVERYRVRTFHRRASLAVRGATSAMSFIQQVGFCTAFSAHQHLPCLWVAICGRRRPRMPHHTHSDYAIGLTWELKDRLPDERRVFYARLLNGKPSLISLEYLPYFYRVFGPQAQDPVGYYERSWLEEEWSRGCYTGMMTPGTWTALGPALREPVGPIHWAGTETAVIWKG